MITPCSTKKVRDDIAALRVIADEIEEYVDIINEHVHGYERWFGSTAGVGPGLETSLTPWRVTSAGVANTFGAAIVLLDGSETPAQTGMLSFDFHRVQVVNVQNNGKTWRLRIANNSEGHANWAAAVAAGIYSDIVLSIDKTNADSTPVDIHHPRVPNGTIFWVAVATLDAVAQWVDILMGFHEYDEAA